LVVLLSEVARRYTSGAACNVDSPKADAVGKIPMAAARVAPNQGDVAHSVWKSIAAGGAGVGVFARHGSLPPFKRSTGLMDPGGGSGAELDWAAVGVERMSGAT
jgi:hypothetical protein